MQGGAEPAVIAGQQAERAELRVLLVEDDETDAFLVEDMLGDVLPEAQLERVRRLKEAMSRVAAAPPVDVALLDLTLPDATGLATFQRLRAAAPEVPLVVLSGLEDERLAQTAVREGAQDYLVKGAVNAAALGRAVRYAVLRTRHRGAADFRASHERFRQLLEESARPTLVLDRARAVRYVNPAAARLLAADGAALLGRELPASALDGAPLELELGPAAARVRLWAADSLWEGALATLALVELAPDVDAPPAAPAAAPDEEPTPRRGLLRATAALSRFEGLRSASPAMHQLFERCLRIAPTDASVLLLGETGTGKELLARAIHRRSGRKGRFVALDCGAVPEGLIESELLGHERGAFTGADQARPGVFRLADGGTLMLDEVGNLSAGAQLSLLRVLQERTVRPVGGSKEHRVDVRVIAATSVPLFEAVNAGTFRSDLLYRLDVIRIEVLPLRERPEDVIHLFQFFLAELAERHELDAPETGPGFLEALLEHDWPGNVRQLENFAERTLLTATHPCLTRRDFYELARPYGARPVDDGPAAAAPADAGAGAPDTALDLTAFVEQQERRYFAALLEECEGRVLEVARRAGVHRKTVFRKLRKFGLAKEEFR